MPVAADARVQCFPQKPDARRELFTASPGHLVRIIEPVGRVRDGLIFFGQLVKNADEKGLDKDRLVIVHIGLNEDGFDSNIMPFESISEIGKCQRCQCCLST